MRIARIANFVSPTSGGIRTALHHWGECYVQAGHETALVVPGPDATIEREDQGLVYHVPGWVVPNTGGYSLILRHHNIISTLQHFRPTHIEVSDRTSLRWLGSWAKEAGIPSMMISHENVTGILERRARFSRPLAEMGANFANWKSHEAFTRIVCPSAFAAEEFHRMGVPARVVPLGVDLVDFVPTDEYHTLTPAGLPRTGDTLHLVHCGRLHGEKNPRLPIETLRHLLLRGVDAHLTVLGSGPLREILIKQSVGLPVTFLDYIADRREVGKVLGRADVALQPGRVETFGLAALEAIACGTPVVCPDEGALQEVVGNAGIATRSTPAAFAAAVVEIAARTDAREVARHQAEQFSWRASAERMVAVHAEAAEELQGSQR